MEIPSLDLNLYQMVCRPRVLSSGETEDEEIDIETFREIKEVLHCPVCFDILKKPLTVRLCGHKFCSHCIKSYNSQV
jgi:hypothetical protein